MRSLVSKSKQNTKQGKYKLYADQFCTLYPNKNAHCTNFTLIFLFTLNWHKYRIVMMWHLYHHIKALCMLTYKTVSKLYNCSIQQQHNNSIHYWSLSVHKHGIKNKNRQIKKLVIMWRSVKMKRYVYEWYVQKYLQLVSII